MKLSESNKKMFLSYFRVVLATVLTAYLAGATKWHELGAAFVAAAIPPAIRFLNPNDKEFGIQ